MPAPACSAAALSRATASSELPAPTQAGTPMWGMAARSWSDSAGLKRMVRTARAGAAAAPLAEPPPLRPLPWRGLTLIVKSRPRAMAMSAACSQANNGGAGT